MGVLALPFLEFMARRNACLMLLQQSCFSRDFSSTLALPFIPVFFVLLDIFLAHQRFELFR